MTKQIIELLNKFYLLTSDFDFPINGNSYYLVKVSKLVNNNLMKIVKSRIEKSTINIAGIENELQINKSYISKCIINISGKNNKLIVKNNVKLRDAIIHIRGDNCTVKIDENTTFGGVRIVNVGIKNDIEIGKNCLFADKIEIWASDTHSIFNERNEMINNEKPITIEDNVWVGSQVTILKGVTIKNNSVIGMGTIVTNNVDSNTISVGTPNRSVSENITWDLNYKNIK